MVLRFIVVMLIDRITNYKKVLALANKVFEALTKNVSTYPSPNPTLTQLEAAIKLLQSLVSQVDAGNRMMLGLRDDACVALYDILQKLQGYANSVGQFDKGTLQLSGFPVRKEPEPAAIPGQVVIKRIINGEEQHTAKIFIERMGMKNLNFFVEMTTTPHIDSSWHTALVISNSRKLILRNLTRGVEIYVRIKAKNSAGMGLLSSPVAFIPTT